MENMEFIFNVTTYDWFLAMEQTGYGSTFCYTSRISVKWVGDKIRTFKPGSVFTATVSVVCLVPLSLPWWLSNFKVPYEKCLPLYLDLNDSWILPIIQDGFRYIFLTGMHPMWKILIIVFGVIFRLASYIWQHKKLKVWKICYNPFILLRECMGKTKWHSTNRLSSFLANKLHNPSLKDTLYLMHGKFLHVINSHHWLEIRLLTYKRLCLWNCRSFAEYWFSSAGGNFPCWWHTCQGWDSRHNSRTLSVCWWWSRGSKASH